MDYQIKRGSSIVATVTPTGQQSKKVMGDNLITMTFDSPVPIAFAKNDYADIFGERYFLKELHDVKKYVTAGKPFEYVLKLKAVAYFLDDVNCLALDAANNYTKARFDLMGSAETFIDLIIANANRTQSGWIKGVIDTTEFKIIPFSNIKCLAALSTVAGAFKLEWWIDGQTIHMTKKGIVEATTLEVGMGKGLYNISRATATDKKLITRLYVYGGEKNIPADYKGYSPNLMLPGALPYIEANVYVNDDPAQGIKYGIIEDSITFDEIYPKRVGTVTAVTDKFTFNDSTIDFDVNLCVLTESPKIVFTTGKLAGYKFEVAKSGFDYATKEFKILSAKNEKDYALPSDELHAEVGDQYFIEDIKMPASYISAEEDKLLAEGWKHLNEFKDQVVVYSVTGDPLNFQQRNISITLGNYIPFIDTDLGLNDNIRIIGFTRDLQPDKGLFEARKYSLELAETNSISTMVASRINMLNMANNVRSTAKESSQAKSAAESIKRINDYWGVSILEDVGIVAGNTLLVGEGANNNAGMTGITDAGGSSVRFYAGASFADRADAPFRVTDDGHVVMTEADITGTVQALFGKIGNFNILDGILACNTGHDDGVGGTVYNIVLIGDNVIPSTAPHLKAVARFENNVPNIDPIGGTGVNYGAIIKASGGDKNIAIDLEGLIVTDGDEGYTGTAAPGTTLTIKNGLIIGVA